MIKTKAIKTFYFLFLILIFICFQLRLFLLTNNIDPNTGFYIKETTISNIFKYLLYGTFLLAVIIPYFTRLPQTYATNLGKNKIWGFSATVLSIICFLNTIEYKKSSVLLPSFAASDSKIKIMKEIIFYVGVVASIVLCLHGINAILGKKIKKESISLLILPVWIILKLGNCCLFEYILVKTVPEHVLNIFALGFFSWFLFLHCTNLFYVFQKNLNRIIFQVGFLSSLFCIISAPSLKTTSIDILNTVLYYFFGFYSLIFLALLIFVKPIENDDNVILDK